MGKKIDRFVFTSILAVSMFFYYESAFKNRALAILLAILSCIMFGKLYRGLKKLLFHTSWHRKQELRRKSGGALMRLACMEREEAHAHISELLKTCYQSSAFVELEQLHPTLQLSSNRIFDLWRAHQEEKELVICTTGVCSSEARVLAQSMKQPKVALLDGAALSQLISEHPHGFYPASEEHIRYKLRMKQLAALLFNRKNAPRCILFSFSMLVMYVFSGNLFYLVFSLALLFVALSSLHHPVRPRKLF